MLLFRCLLLASLVSQTLPAAQAEAHCPGKIAGITFRFVQSSLIVIPVQVNHSGPFDFMVDTGAQVSTIDASLAEELHLKPQSAVGVAGAATYVQNALVYLDHLRAGDHAVANSPAVIMDVAQLGMADRRVRGVLGASFLEHFDLFIDNERRILCLDETGALASAIKGHRVLLAEPHGSQKDLPFTRPIVVSARLSAMEKTHLLLRLDSGSNAPMLYADDSYIQRASLQPGRVLKRKMYGIEQDFAVLPPQEVRIGKSSVKEVAFAIPLNQIGTGGPVPREDGLLPTMAYKLVFISCRSGYAILQPWNR